jgi:hypothetical protein
MTKITRVYTDNHGCPVLVDKYNNEYVHLSNYWTHREDGYIVAPIYYNNKIIGVVNGAYIDSEYLESVSRI